MFIDERKFRRAFKNAYDSTGVQVMCTPDRLYITTPQWAVEIERFDVPNKILAAIIEMCGEIPACGFAYTAKRGECNQETIVYSVWTPSEKYVEEKARKVDKTPMFYRLQGCQEWRILQLCDNGECILVESDLLELISKKAIDEENESYPQYAELCGEYLIWQNCMGAFAIKAKQAMEQTKEDEVMRQLAKVNLSPEHWSRAIERYKGGEDDEEGCEMESDD